MPITCQITRGDIIESMHIVYAVVTDQYRNIVFSSGESTYQTCIRSALKPFQAAVGVLSGAVDSAGFSDKELALMCASHNGESIHTETAQSMLQKLHYTVEDYECGSHPSYDQKTRNKMLLNNQKFSPLNNNCSGKHAGMLALSKHLGVDPKGYTQPDHPVQELILTNIKKYCGLDKIRFGIDGCSAPTPFMELKSIAILFQQLAANSTPELKRIHSAMTAYPYLLAGKNRFDTDFNFVLKGRAITKVGGEAVRGLGITNENGQTYGIALKVLDGNQRANHCSMMALLDHLGYLLEEEKEALDKWVSPKLYNHRKIQIGEISVVIDA